MKGNLFDTHFHLDLQKSKELAINVIEQNKIYTIAVTNLPPLFEKLNSNVKSKYVRIALGFHPELIGQYQKYIPDMWRLLPDVKYVGEVGLDLKTNKESRKLQISFFEELISRCNEIGGKVLSVHSRMAASEVVSIIGEQFNGKIILHWYSGSKQIQLNAINIGCYFSVNYAMLNSESGEKIVKNIPNDRILIETDSPFIPINGQVINQLSNINKTIENLALLMDLKFDELKNMLWKNFESILKT
ncbi:MAG: Qat anti-phage system TatD family nuclease QatD [Bacteroidota bacterium]|nr:Qat anti-phage system TatD family nuclease QatD [Bacteroidota bacterium]